MRSTGVGPIRDCFELVQQRPISKEWKVSGLVLLALSKGSFSASRRGWIPGMPLDKRSKRYVTEASWMTTPQVNIDIFDRVSSAAGDIPAL